MRATCLNCSRKVIKRSEVHTYPVSEAQDVAQVGELAPIALDRNQR